MQTPNFIRVILFVLFFSIGAASLSGAILCDDLVQYYRNRQLLKSAQQSLEQLKSLTNDYDVLLSQLENDPNLVRRIARPTLGIEPEDANTAYPRATAEQLAAARRALTEDADQQSAEPVMPAWLSRCDEPRRRTALFFSGVALILISFICFGPARPTQEKTE